MKIKNFAIGALAAAMLFTGTSVMEGGSIYTSAGRLPYWILAPAAAEQRTPFLLKIPA